jgi:hypothetical protein
MHFCTAHIALGGDDRNILHRDEFSPVSWPEIEVIRVLHGDDSVTQIRPFVEVYQDPRAERNRLAGIYGDKPLEIRWGGRNAPTEMEAPRATLASDTYWFNPLSRQTERTGRDGKSSKPADPPRPVSPIQATGKAESVGMDFVPPPEPPRDENPFYVDDEEEQPKAAARKR